MTELITIPEAAKQFTIQWTEADGTKKTETYYAEDRLSIERYERFERFRLEVGFGLSFVDLVKVLNSNIDLCDRIATGEKVFTTLVTTNYNALKAINEAATKKPFAVWLCTLFLNTKDEDRRWFDEAVMREKIRQWEAAGVDSSFFLRRALGLVESFSAISSSITEMSLGMQEAISAEQESETPSP